MCVCVCARAYISGELPVHVHGFLTVGLLVYVCVYVWVCVCVCERKRENDRARRGASEVTVLPSVHRLCDSSNTHTHTERHTHGHAHAHIRHTRTYTHTHILIRMRTQCLNKLLFAATLYDVVCHCLCVCVSVCAYVSVWVPLCLSLSVCVCVCACVRPSFSTRLAPFALLAVFYSTPLLFHSPLDQAATHSASIQRCSLSQLVQQLPWYVYVCVFLCVCARVCVFLCLRVSMWVPAL